MSLFRIAILLIPLVLALAGAASAPAAASAPGLPAPKWAIAQADRTPDFDPRPGFKRPPPGFGIVPFYWWLGDPLTRERLRWQLDRMAGMGVAGYQINYAHSDQGGRSYGLTFPSDPPLFSEAWWDLSGWFLREARRQGAAISLSDYTLGFGQGWCVDELLREHPEVRGSRLRMNEDGTVVPETLPWSLNPLHPMSGKWYAEKFFGQFERRFPGEPGRGLNFFFSDELDFGVAGHLWSEGFAEEFTRRKGYDVLPELQALFKDTGPRTPKIRLDYSDVMVALAEEGFFKPVYDWHQRRGMTLGCDHGGRGQNVVEFGDYFRTQRWMQAPGADQPNLGKNLIKAKVAASIAHLYERPRVWLEGFYGSGWGTTSAGIVDATFANYVMGFNMLGLHGMYYSTHGGWWEWAPPDNTFRMPYWTHLREFMVCLQRLSFLLSQGHHRCDVAILYPVAAMESGMDGERAVETAFKTGRDLYARSVDFDFVDFESLARAAVQDRELRVSGEAYRVLILPAMRAVRHSTLQKAVEFHRAGGVVLALGALPEASDRVGRNDPEVASMVRELFPTGPEQDLFARLPGRDYEGPGYVQHRRIGPRDLYALYNAREGAECFFRATGKVELWDPWTGSIRPLPILSQTSEGTRLRLPLSEKEMQLIVFSPGKPRRAELAAAEPRSLLRLEGDWEFELQPTLDNRFGDFHWPPTPSLVGPEVRQLWYCEGDHTNGPWRKVTCSFGPQFVQSSNQPPSADSRPYELSWRWGIENDPGHQGYHGLKGRVHDEFLAVGKPKNNGNHMPTVLSYEGDAEHTFFSTAVVAPRTMTAYALIGPIPPGQVWLNGKVVDGTRLELEAGPNPLTVRFDKPGRTYFVVSDAAPAPAGASNDPGYTNVFISGDLAMSWWTDTHRLQFDVRAGDPNPVGWYRFLAPPGLRAFTVSGFGKVQAWADSQPLAGAGYFVLPRPAAAPATVWLRIEQARGCYGGAAFREPIQLDCGPGRLPPGDWSKLDALETYSGGAWYRTTVPLAKAQLRGRQTLDLGSVAASAEVVVNGKPAGVRVAPPWRVDVSGLLKPGNNRLEILVRNTLANHYVTVPTRYRGALTSGLLGPVKLELD